jgi:hypothetical protein
VGDETARYRYGVVLSHHDPGYLELRWLPATAEMTDEDWMTGLMVLATEAAAIGTSAILIEATQFGHSFADRDACMTWRDEHVIPLYNRAGVKRFAFVMPNGFPGPTAESGGQPQIDGSTAQFLTQWFLDRSAAVAWLERG